VFFPAQSPNAGGLGQTIGRPVQTPVQSSNSGRLGTTFNRPGAPNGRRRKRRQSVNAMYGSGFMRLVWH
jgi:hypothetical protein